MCGSNKWLDIDVRRWTFLMEEVLLWIMDSYLAKRDGLKLKRLDGFVSYKHEAFH